MADAFRPTAQRSWKKILEDFMPTRLCHIGGITTEEWVAEREAVAKDLAQAVEILAQQQGARWTN